jgi:hypothetical protein
LLTLALGAAKAAQSLYRTTRPTTRHLIQEDKMSDATTTPEAPEAATYATTRQRLHGIGECLMAGPQRRAGGRFTLRVTPGGFATTGGPALRIDGTNLVVDERTRVAIAGTFADMADALGVDFGAPPDGYPDGSGASATDDVSLDTASAFLMQDWYLRADAALRVMAPRETPILWPEHFDVAILLDHTSYGASPGDDSNPTPYAYVSSTDHDGSDFWNAPFGAIRGYEQMRTVGDLVTFWRAGQTLLEARAR